MSANAAQAMYGNRYRALEAVGSGGMATVYRGEDIVLGREVAIKVMHPHLAARTDARARFSREAKAIARLRHPNIVDVYDFSQGEDDNAYLVTEFVSGVTLSEFCQRHGPLLPQSAALIGAAVASALAHAHDAGIVHRDIKPDNLMIAVDGTIKLMDFGIATAVDLEQMTATGAILGSPAHMAPEQIEGLPIDARVDVFAFGTLLYYLCTGQLPFMASNPHALFRLILDGVYEQPSRRNPAISRRFEEILAGCLARDRDQRWSRMALVHEALGSYLRDHQMGDIERLLPRLLTAPEQFQLEHRPLLVSVLCSEGRQHARDGSLALAIDAYNRALAMDADAVEPRQGLSELTSKSRRKRRIRVAASIGFGAALAIFAAVALQRYPLQRTVPAPVPRGPLSAEAVSAPLPLPPATAQLAAAEERARAEQEQRAAVAQLKAQAAVAAAAAAAAALAAAGSEDERKVREERPSAAPSPRRARAEVPEQPVAEEPVLAPPGRSAGPKQVGPPEPREGLVEVMLGSIPPIAALYLNDELVSQSGYKRLPLVSGREYTLRCEPFAESCPACPGKDERRFKVPDTPPDRGTFSVKCDFTRYVDALPR